MSSPDYSKYSLEQLQRVQRKIDRINFPERAKEVDERIASFVVSGAEKSEADSRAINGAGDAAAVTSGAWSFFVGVLSVFVGAWQLISLAVPGDVLAPMSFHYRFESQSHLMTSSAFVGVVAIVSTGVIASLFVIGGVGWCLKKKRIPIFTSLGLVLTAVGVSIGRFQFDVNFIFSVFFGFGFPGFGISLDFISLAILVVLAFLSYRIRQFT